MLGWLKEYHTEMLIWTGKEKYTLAEHEEIISHRRPMIPRRRKRDGQASGALARALCRGRRPWPDRRSTRATSKVGPQSYSVLARRGALIGGLDQREGFRDCRRPRWQVLSRLWRQSTQCRWMAARFPGCCARASRPRAEAAAKHRFMAHALRRRDRQPVALAEAQRALDAIDLDQRFGKGLRLQLRGIAAIDHRGRRRSHDRAAWSRHPRP